MVAAANPLAAEAGRDILRAGGSAADAAIAVQLVLNLVEPQSSGIGGGAFLVHWDEARKQVLDPRRPRDRAGRRHAGPLPGRRRQADEASSTRWSAAARSACPARCELLEEAHKRWGRLPWAELFAPAIKLAEDGFAVSPRLNGLLAQREEPDQAMPAPPPISTRPTASRGASAPS